MGGEVNNAKIDAFKKEKWCPQVSPAIEFSPGIASSTSRPEHVGHPPLGPAAASPCPINADPMRPTVTAATSRSRRRGPEPPHASPPEPSELTAARAHLRLQHHCACSQNEPPNAAAAQDTAPPPPDPRPLPQTRLRARTATAHSGPDLALPSPIRRRRCQALAPRGHRVHLAAGRRTAARPALAARTARLLKHRSRGEPPARPGAAERRDEQAPRRRHPRKRRGLSRRLAQAAARAEDRAGRDGG